MGGDGGDGEDGGDGGDGEAVRSNDFSRFLLARRWRRLFVVTTSVVSSLLG
ncbi:MAG: hypothetical protein ACRC8Y_07165 [Chroococcales cyanobacterium]